jgi:hypothetical protein
MHVVAEILFYLFIYLFCLVKYFTLWSWGWLNMENVALEKAGHKGQKMEGAYSCLQFSKYS